LLVGGHTKLNFDGSKYQIGLATRYVTHDWKGSFIIAGARFVNQAFILVAETAAPRHAMKDALEP